jgi:hypothetical protein
MSGVKGGRPESAWTGEQHKLKKTRHIHCSTTFFNTESPFCLRLDVHTSSLKCICWKLPDEQQKSTGFKPGPSLASPRTEPGPLITPESVLSQCRDHEKGEREKAAPSPSNDYRSDVRQIKAVAGKQPRRQRLLFLFIRPF